MEDKSLTELLLSVAKLNDPFHSSVDELERAQLPATEETGHVEQSVICDSHSFLVVSGNQRTFAGILADQLLCGQFLVFIAIPWAQCGRHYSRQQKSTERKNVYLNFYRKTKK
jgi:hypothetical protein